MSRILLVHQPVDGGVGRHVRDLHDGLTERGYETVLCGPAPPAAYSGDHDSDAATLVSTPEFTGRHIELSMERAIHPRSDLAALRRYVRVLRAVRPDLVHAHSSKAGAIARLGRLACPGVPVLYTAHGYAFAGFFAHELDRVAYREAERLLSPLTTRAIAVCVAEADRAAQVGLRGRVDVVYNGLRSRPTGPTDPAALDLSRRGPVVCTVARLSEGKGLETLLDAAAEVVVRHPDLQLAIVGDGPLRTALGQRAAARGIGESVHFLGGHADPRAVMQASDLFVLPSWAESFPYAVLEAMSLDLPVVASDVGGVSEAITDGHSGRLVPPGDPAALSSAITSLLEQPELRARMGRIARAVVNEQFSFERMIESLDRIYGQLVGPAQAVRQPGR